MAAGAGASSAASPSQSDSAPRDAPAPAANDPATKAAREIEIQKIRQPVAGAITSPGETFQGPGHDGIARYTIPFPVTPARGFEPGLALEYNSAGGNGVFGTGMSAGPASIAFATNRHYPTYIGGDDYVFGGDRIVETATPPETRVEDGQSFQVRFYRRRIESDFSRLEHFLPETGGPGFWRCLTREGEICIFGCDVNSRIADPTDPNRVFEWLLVARYTPKGEAIRYSYKREDMAGVDGASVARVQGANLYPVKIAYGALAPFVPAHALDLPSGPFYFEILFDYGEYDLRPENDTPTTPVRPWPCRQDPFSNYTAGFERRTNRLCHNIIMVHRFPDELGTPAAPVRVLSLAYVETPYHSRLVSAQIWGWWVQADHPPGQRYHVKPMPALRLTWSDLAPTPPVFSPLRFAPGAVPPRFGDPPPYALADIDGRGLPGVVYADGASIFYFAPTLAAAEIDAEIVYEAMPMATFPSGRSVSGTAALADLDGSGILSLTVKSPVLTGYFPRGPDGGWENFRPFAHVSTEDPTVPAQHVDLTGDGREDVLRVSTDHVAYRVNLGRGGTGPSVRRARDVDVPLTAPRPEWEQVSFADVLGGGTAPAVLARAGSVRAWPNLGYGRFGEAIDLSAPALGMRFPPERLLFADLTGDGCTDMVLPYTTHLEIYRNVSGNRFSSEAIVIMLPAPLRDLSQLRAASLDGLGYDSLVFTSDEPNPRHWHCRLAGSARPGLVTAIANGRGHRIEITYASSARYQLLDKREGREWVTTLAAPVPVVASTREIDVLASVTRRKTYRYGHGYYNAAMREFQGFGLVETRECDTGAAEDGASNPLLIREWVHTGAVLASGTLEDAFAKEYWNGDPLAYPMPPSYFDWQGVEPDGETWRQAVAALAGTVLHRETFPALDASVPLTVEAGNATARLEQARSDRRPAVFCVTPREHISAVYESEAHDPRIEHEVNLAIDPLGDVTLSCEAAYARRSDAPDILPAQKLNFILATQHAFVPPVSGPNLWLASLPQAQTDWSLPHPPTPKVRGLYYDFAQLSAAVDAALAPDGGGELLGATKIVYAAAAGGESPPGAIAPQALVLGEETLSFDPAALARLFADAQPPGGLDTFLAAQGYRLDPADKLWWNPGLTQDYAGAETFYRPVGTRDPFAMRQDVGGRFGTITTYTYDSHGLLIVATTAASSGKDVLALTETALALDYRNMAVTRLADENGRVHETLLDPLGAVVAESFYGEEWRDGAPVRDGFAVLPLDNPASWPQAPDAASLVMAAPTYLSGAASVHLVDWGSFERDGQPVAIVAVTAQDFPGGVVGPPGVSITFLDGFERELQIKVQTEAGPAYAHDGRAVALATERWMTTGGRHYNGLGLPDREYEPYFTDHFAYTNDPGLNKLGVTLLLTYDALGRHIRTDYPKGGMAKAFFSQDIIKAWSLRNFDRDDTVKASNYYQFYIDRSGQPPLPPHEREALLKAAVFADTADGTHFDARGLAIVTEQILTSAREPARVVLDSAIAYNPSGTITNQADPLRRQAGLWNLTYERDFEDRVIRMESVDAGTRWMLEDVIDNLVFLRDGRGVGVLHNYDGLHRLSSIDVITAPGAQPITAALFVHGNSLDAGGLPPFAAPGPRGIMDEVCVTYDGAGRTEAAARALTDGVTAQSQWLAKPSVDVPDWTCAPQPSWAALFAALAEALEPEEFLSAAGFDARGRMIAQTSPGGISAYWRYQRAGLLASLAAARDGESPAEYLGEIDYNAKSQQVSMRLGPADAPLARTVFTYDVDTFDLTGIASARVSDGVKLQDLTYWRDPEGNVSYASDAAPPAQPDVSPDLDYVYDSLYRLTGNSGRAIAGYSPDTAATGSYQPYFPSPKVDRYDLSYKYDDADNLQSTHYEAAGTSWTQELTIAPDSNRGALAHGNLTGWFDANGNQLKLGADQTLAWTWANELAAVILVPRENGTPDADYFSYHATGARARVRAERLVEGQIVQREEISIGALTIVRTYEAGAITAERRSLRLLDGEQSVAELRDWTIGAPRGPTPRDVRYQLSTLIQSCVLELSDKAETTSFEEYAPYGATVFAGGQSLAEVSLKQFRYSAKSRESASGLYYYGARYYAPWLGRWLSPDPAGTIDGLNLYEFTGGDPVSHIDVGGYGRTKQSARKTSRQKKSTAKKANTKLSGFDLKRPSFRAHANKLKLKGTDLAHRFSAQSMKQALIKHKLKQLSKQKAESLLKSIAGPKDKALHKEIEKYFKLASPTQSQGQDLLGAVNSAPHNLRPGNSGRNRSIKEHVDGNYVKSSNPKPSRARSRSPSPSSRRIVSSSIESGIKPTFHTGSDGRIMSSTAVNGIKVTDLVSSLTDSMGKKVTYSKSGNVVTLDA